MTIEYTSISMLEVEAILADFSITKIDNINLLSGGSVNTNYLIITKSGKYVLTLCEQTSEKEAKELANLLEYLEQQQFETSKIIRNTKNESLTLWKGRPIIIKKYIEGKILKEIPSHLIELIGRELGKLHKIKAPEDLPLQLTFGKEQFVNVEKYASHSTFDVWLKKMLEYVSPFIFPDLPRAFIHADVFFSNVVIREDSVILIDFEEATNYYRIFDIGMMIIGICGEEEIVNLEKAKFLLSGYLREIELLDMEFNALQAFTVYAGAAMTFWRHMNFNYTKPDSRLSNHYMGLKVLTDYVKEQPADYFLERLGFD